MPTPPRPISLRVLIVDDDPDHAELLRLALERLTGVDLTIHACHNAAEGLRHLARHACDLAFVDYRLGPTTGDTFISDVRGRGIDTVIVAVTSLGDQYAAADVTRAGAQHFLMKDDFDTPRLEAVFREALEQAAAVSEQQDEHHDAQQRLDKLTPREREVLELVVEGLLSKQIAVKLGCAEGTVKLHRSRMLAKTGAQTTGELVRLAMLARGRGLGN